MRCIVFLMNIDILALKSAPGTEFPFIFEADAERLEQTDSDVEMLSPLKIRMKAVYRDGILYINGSMQATIRLACSRCLEVFQAPFNWEFSEEIPVGTNKFLNLIQLFREIFLTSLPLKPLCSDDCRGLCAICGADLNRQQCDCPREETDPRLEVLKQLLRQ